MRPVQAADDLNREVCPVTPAMPDQGAAGIATAVAENVQYQGRKGAPDRWCFFPGNRLLIVECKRPKKNKLDPLQEVEVEWLQGMGFNAGWLNTKEQVDTVIREFLRANPAP